MSVFRYTKMHMLIPPKIVTAFKAAREPITSAALVAAMVATALAVGAEVRPLRRVGVDWEHRQFMLPSGQDPIVPEPPHRQGPVWYVEPPSRRI
jgi:hypothetical protein